MSDAILSLTNFTFGRNDIALYPQSPVNYQISPTELLTVTGPSGAGKSTFLHSLFKPSLRVSGSLYWQSTERGFGYMPQNASRENILFTVCDIVALGYSTYGASPSAKARKAAIDLLGSLGIAHLSNSRLADISAGEQQRVLFARAIALASNSQLVLLDEPTSNLDNATKEFIHSQVAIFREQGYAFIAVTHDLSFAIAHSSHMLALTSGKASVLPASEIETSGVIDALLGGAL